MGLLSSHHTDSSHSIIMGQALGRLLGLDAAQEWPADGEQVYNLIDRRIFGRVFQISVTIIRPAADPAEDVIDAADNAVIEQQQQQHQQEEQQQVEADELVQEVTKDMDKDNTDVEAGEPIGEAAHHEPTEEDDGHIKDNNEAGPVTAESEEEEEEEKLQAGKVTDTEQLKDATEAQQQIETVDVDDNSDDDE